MIEGHDNYLVSGFKYTIKHLSEYNIEYAGIVAGSKNLIICQMLLSDRDVVNYGRADYFSSVLDGGFSILTILYDPKSKTVVSLSWHGEA